MSCSCLFETNTEKNNYETGQGKSFLAPFFAVLTVFAMLLSMCGCSRKVVLTTGFAKDEVFTLGDEKCTLPEMLVYLTDIQNQYESVYGAGIWQAEYNGVTLEDNVKETVLARAAQIKTMYLLAVSKGLTLTDEEKAEALEMAEDYYSALTADQIEYLGITQEKLEKMYEEYMLADSVYDAVIAEINPEISDDEARTVVAWQIVISTGETDADGTFHAYDQEKKVQLYNMAMEIKQRAEDGEDFESLIAEYSESEEKTVSVDRESVDAVVESVVFNLETDEISQIVETEEGLHIYKCISTLDREQTAANKQVLVEKRRQAVFKEEYDNFAEGLLKNLNTELWDGIELNHDITISEGFFEIYDSWQQDEE